MFEVDRLKPEYPVIDTNQVRSVGDIELRMPCFLMWNSCLVQNVTHIACGECSIIYYFFKVKSFFDSEGSLT